MIREGRVLDPEKGFGCSAAFAAHTCHGRTGYRPRVLGREEESLPTWFRWVVIPLVSLR